MPGAHSIIPMSSAGRRVQCPASAVLELMHPEAEDKEASRQGTAAHELIPAMIHGFARGGTGVPDRDETIGTTAANGVAHSADTFDGAMTCALDVQRVMRETAVFGGDYLQVEQPVTAPRIHPQSWGTPDVWLFDQRGGRLYVWDYKHGHRPVEVVENWQLVEYGAGILEQITGDKGVGLEDQHIEIVFTIVQPRAQHRDGPIRRWTVKASDLRPLTNIAADAEHKALSAEPPMQTGPECLDCKARHVCTALAKKAGAAMDVAQRSDTHSLSSDALGVELRMLYAAEQALKARRTGLEAQAEGVIQAGGTVPGIAAETTFGRAQWLMPVDQIAQVGDMMGVDLRKPADVVTPRQAEQKGLSAELVKQYSHKPATGTKLVVDSQSRAARVFGQSKGEA